jgi:hypothetical protein
VFYPLSRPPYNLKIPMNRLESSKLRKSVQPRGMADKSLLNRAAGLVRHSAMHFISFGVAFQEEKVVSGMVFSKNGSHINGFSVV